jgi:hypothetical protein
VQSSQSTALSPCNELLKMVGDRTSMVSCVALVISEGSVEMADRHDRDGRPARDVSSIGHINGFMDLPVRKLRWHVEPTVTCTGGLTSPPPDDIMSATLVPYINHTKERDHWQSEELLISLAVPHRDPSSFEIRSSSQTDNSSLHSQTVSCYLVVS